MDDHNQQPSGDPDNGLRRMIRWTAAALVGSLLFAAVAVYFVERWFNHP